MTRTIVKTGCVLQLPTNDRTGFADDVSNVVQMHGIATTLYGDLHVVGNCAIMYFPLDQVRWKTIHGKFRFNGNSYFIRKANPYCILVILASEIVMEFESLHENDRNAWQLAGGRLAVGGIPAS